MRLCPRTVEDMGGATFGAYKDDLVLPMSKACVAPTGRHRCVGPSCVGGGGDGRPDEAARRVLRRCLPPGGSGGARASRRAYGPTKHAVGRARRRRQRTAAGGCTMVRIVILILALAMVFFFRSILKMGEDILY